MGAVVTLALVLVAIGIGLPGLVTAAHLTVLTLASLAYREDLPATAATPLRFLILIPAHNEEEVIGAALTAINVAIRPQDSVLVIADRCTDRTAEVARAYGAQVLERPPDSPPGRAATRQAGMEAAAGLGWDALVMIDADSVLQPAGFLNACERALRPGVDALQVRGETIPGPSVMPNLGRRFRASGSHRAPGPRRAGLLGAAPGDRDGLAPQPHGALPVPRSRGVRGHVVRPRPLLRRHSHAPRQIQPVCTRTQQEVCVSHLASDCAGRSVGFSRLVSFCAHCSAGTTAHLWRWQRT
jgi:hypothetical protein